VLTVAVRVKPGASRNRVGGAYPGRYGTALVVAVTARAVDGRATEATRRALAGTLSVPASAVSLRAGAASRDKLFTVDTAGTAAADGRGGGASCVTDRLHALLSGPP
jgi:uncharacterized protein YggU (UPF0235/DUF167 family)